MGSSPSFSTSSHSTPVAEKLRAAPSWITQIYQLILLSLSLFLFSLVLIFSILPVLSKQVSCVYAAASAVVSFESSLEWNSKRSPGTPPTAEWASFLFISSSSSFGVPSEFVSFYQWEKKGGGPVPRSLLVLGHHRCISLGPIHDYEPGCAFYRRITGSRLLGAVKVWRLYSMTDTIQLDFHCRWADFIFCIGRLAPFTTGTRSITKIWWSFHTSSTFSVPSDRCTME